MNVPTTLTICVASAVKGGTLLRDSTGDFLLVHNVVTNTRARWISGRPPVLKCQYIWCFNTRPWCAWGDRGQDAWPIRQNFIYEVVATDVPEDAKIETLRALGCEHVRRHGMASDDDVGTIPTTARAAPLKLTAT